MPFSLCVKPCHLSLLTPSVPVLCVPDGALSAPLRTRFCSMPTVEEVPDDPDTDIPQVSRSRHILTPTYRRSVISPTLAPRYTAGRRPSRQSATIQAAGPAVSGVIMGMILQQLLGCKNDVPQNRLYEGNKTPLDVLLVFVERPQN